MNPLVLTGWDFYFLIAGVIGLYAIHRLALVREEGEIDRKDMLAQVFDQTRRSVRNLSTVAGFRAATEWPATLLRDARERARAGRLAWLSSGLRTAFPTEQDDRFAAIIKSLDQASGEAPAGKS